MLVFHRVFVHRRQQEQQLPPHYSEGRLQIGPTTLSQVSRWGRGEYDGGGMGEGNYKTSMTQVGKNSLSGINSSSHLASTV